MKASRTGLFALVILALMVQESYALNAWLTSYLEGMDQLVLLAWRNIYYYTWLVLPRWVLCAYFFDLGKMLFDYTQTVTDDELIEECYTGVSNYFDATMYGGSSDNIPFPYFRSFYRAGI